MASAALGVARSLAAGAHRGINGGDLKRAAIASSAGRAAGLPHIGAAAGHRRLAGSVRCEARRERGEDAARAAGSLENDKPLMAPSKSLHELPESADSRVALSALAASLMSIAFASSAHADVISSVAEEQLGYSEASYYTSLGLFIISIPGLWSLIKRATKSKIVRRTFEVPGPAAVATTGGKPLAQVAGEITSLLNRSNYRVSDSSKRDVVTFVGDIVPSKSQAAFLVFCTALSLASVALVLSITNPDVGEWWYSITLLSPLAGVYYWRKATRTEEIQVKIVISDDEKTADITMQGDDEEIERVRRELGIMEKGLEYVKGIFEG